jgi:multicomponent Na+:H+ antiporter subunit D
LSVISHLTPIADWVVVLPVILCLGGAALLLALRTLLRWQAWLALVILFAVILCDGVLLERILATGPVSMTMGRWLPPFGISFTADAMGVLFATVSGLVAFAVVLALMLEAPESAVRDGLYPLVLLLMAGVSGAFLTGDVFNLYVWFEVMLIASFGLVSLAGNPLQLDAAVKYGVLNFVATALFLAAVALLYGTLGTLNMADIIGTASKADPLTLVAIASLFLLAFGMKAAVFPMNAWLPASYHAPPAPISALMGGVLTKVGVYALLRLLVMLLPAERAMLSPAITALAVATMLLGPLSAIAETNLRRAVGFLLIGGVGVAITGAVTSGAVLGAVVYVGQSVLAFAALYLVAGLVESATGTTDTRDMGGLYAASSRLSIMFLVLALSVAGIPPFLGFWPKLLLLQGYISDGNWLLVMSVLLSSLLSLIAGARLWSFVFWHPRSVPLVRPRGYAPAVLLTGTVLLLGLAPNLLIKAGNVAARDLLDPVRYITAVGLSP